MTAALPVRSEGARARLVEVAGQVRPFVAAGDRLLAVDGALGARLPGGGVRRGATVAVDGVLGAGVTSVTLALVAAATAAGEWAAIIDPYGTLGARAAQAAGVELERCAVIRRGPADRWSTVVAALLDGVALVAATVPPRLRVGDARRLVARARSARPFSSRSGHGRSKRRCGCTPKVANGAVSTRGAAASTPAISMCVWKRKAHRRGAARRARGLVMNGPQTTRTSSQTTRTCCVWCPDWPVVAVRRRDPLLHAVPVVVRERVGSRDLVRAASADARENGVTRGMRRREAEARCPNVEVVHADLALEARTFELVARAVETVTPRVVLDRPGRCSFPTRGPSRYFGGDTQLAERLHAVIVAALDDDADVRIGVADGEFTAGLAARRARTRNRW